MHSLFSHAEAQGTREIVRTQTEAERDDQQHPLTIQGTTTDIDTGKMPRHRLNLAD